MWFDEAEDLGMINVLAFLSCAFGILLLFLVLFELHWKTHLVPFRMDGVEPCHAGQGQERSGSIWLLLNTVLPAKPLHSTLTNIILLICNAMVLRLLQ